MRSGFTDSLINWLIEHLFSVALSTAMVFGLNVIHTTEAAIKTPTVYAQTVEVSETTVEKDEGLCSCVIFARRLLPQLPLGNASELAPNSPYPRVGGVVIINYSGTYHLAYVSGKVSPTGDIPLHDANYERCKETWRTINVNDPRIVGYWFPPEV